MTLTVVDVIAIVIWKQVVVLVVHSSSMCPRSWQSPVRPQLFLNRLKTRGKSFTTPACPLIAALWLHVTRALLKSTTSYCVRQSRHAHIRTCTDNRRGEASRKEGHGGHTRQIYVDFTRSCRASPWTTKYLDEFSKHLERSVMISPYIHPVAWKTGKHYVISLYHKQKWHVHYGGRAWENRLCYITDTRIQVHTYRFENEPAMCKRLPTLWATLWECGGGGGLSKLLTLPSLEPPPPMSIYPTAISLSNFQCV